MKNVSDMMGLVFKTLLKLFEKSHFVVYLKAFHAHSCLFMFEISWWNLVSWRVLDQRRTLYFRLDGFSTTFHITPCFEKSVYVRNVLMGVSWSTLLFLFFRIMFLISFIYHWLSFESKEIKSIWLKRWVHQIRCMAPIAFLVKILYNAFYGYS